MKSKRKQVNKYKTKGEDQLEEKEQDYMKRATGNKPFQLNHLRATKRHNLEALTGKYSLDLMKKKNTQEDVQLEQGDVCLNLVIKKKLIIDNQLNQKLESERKSLIYLDYQNDLHSVLQGPIQENNKTEEIEIDGTEEDVFTKHQSLDMFNGITHKKKPKKCQCCQYINSCQATVKPCPLNEHNLLNESLGGNQNISEAEIKQPKVKHQSETKTSITSRSFVPPYTFTSLKWRSKSEMLQVDKWKEKYGRPDYSKSIEKIKNHEQRSVATVTVFEKKFHEEERKGKLIRLKNQREMNLQKRGERFTPLPSLKQSAKMLKIDERRKSHTDALPTNITIQTKVSDSREAECKQKKLHKQIEDYKTSHKIIIKQMYSEASNEIEPATVNPQQEEMNVEKKQKRLIKKNKFPEVKFSTFYSAGEIDDQKKQMLKILANQRSQHEWKERPPKKIFLEKMMEEIPQRWEYGESRDSDRSEMGFYMRFKNDEELRLQKEQEENLIIKILQGNKSELQTL